MFDTCKEKSFKGSGLYTKGFFYSFCGSCYIGYTYDYVSSRILFNICYSNTSFEYFIKTVLVKLFVIDLEKTLLEIICALFGVRLR